MEFEDNYEHHKTNFGFLAQQVEEQSELCDLIVKKGLWEKKFHRCVLAVSPFFENIIKGNFVQKQTGIVEIKIDTTSNAVDMALMFLYGKKPAFTIDNVKYLLELAEFFMIKGLKSACINWLRSEDITKDNCLHVMQLSTLYNFEVTSSFEYIESHLPETFCNQDAVILSKDTLEYLFFDRRFSYITMDEKLTFLLKWVCAHPTETKENITSLFKTIDIKEVSYPVWENAKCNDSFNKMIDLQNMVRNDDVESMRRNVLVMAAEEDCLLSLDLQNDRWYRLNSDTYKSKFVNRYCEAFDGIIGVRNSLPEIFFIGGNVVGPDQLDCTVSTLNLENDQTNTYSLTLTDEVITNGTNTLTELSSINLTDDKVIAVVNRTVKLTQISSRPRSQTGIHLASPGPSRLSNYHGREKELMAYKPIAMNNTRILKNCKLTSSSGENYFVVRNIKYSMVYVGFTSEETFEMSPIFSLRNESISHTCTNRLSTIALLTHSERYVILFDFADYKMEKIELEQDKDYKVGESETGFIIYNNKRCYYLTRLSGSCLSKKYLVEKRELEQHEGSRFVRYIYCNDIWIRFVCRDVEDGIKFQYVLSEDLLASQSPCDINWKQLSLPDDGSDIIHERLFVVRLSKCKLRCDIACPHCGSSGSEDKCCWDYLSLCMLDNKAKTDSDHFYDEEEEF